MNLEQRLFDDKSRHLDRFGLLLFLAISSVTVNSLIDLDEPTANVRSEIAWIGASIIVGLTLMVAIRASGVVRRWEIVVDIFVGIAVAVAIVISLLGESGVATVRGLSGARPALAWVVIAFLSPIVVTRRIMHHERVSRETLFGAVSAFLLIALAFDYLYLSLSSWSSVEFFGEVEPTSTFMYFSLVTITTLGYGDVSPVTEVGRYFATAEAVIGQVFLVTIVARLVSLFGTDRAPAMRASRAQLDERPDT